MGREKKVNHVTEDIPGRHKTFHTFVSLKITSEEVKLEGKFNYDVEHTLYTLYSHLFFIRMF